LEDAFEITIRPARPSDASAIAQVNVATWRDTYVGILSDDSLTEMNDIRAAGRWSRTISDLRPGESFFVADWEGQIVGFAQGGRPRGGAQPSKSGDGRYGELYTLYVDPCFQNMGIGTALFSALADGLRQVGYDALCLMALTQSLRSRGFYESLGGLAEQDIPCVVMGQPVSETLYVWEDLDVLLARLEAVGG
jgi:ribosomal protein S18 acetylase RimI-like enzyme